MRTKTRKAENSIVNDADQKTIKRAQWEAFEFEVEAPGLIRVSNGSYENPADHSYIVNVETDSPVACQCPAFEYGDGPCKHMVAVVIRQAVLLAAQSVPMPDGGEVTESCPNGQMGCCGPDGDELPCFECYREESSDRIRLHGIDGGQLEHLRDELTRIAGDLHDGSQSARHLGSHSGRRD